MYGSTYMNRHYIATFRERSLRFLRDAQLRSSRCNIVDGRVVSSDAEKALGTLLEDGNGMPKHAGATVRN
jgi:hypothetical protein